MPNDAGGFSIESASDDNVQPLAWQITGGSMHVLLIHCHPCADSFSAALRDTSIGALKAAGHTVDVRDLYREGFCPTLTATQRALFYDESANQAGIEDHVEALRKAEALLLVYPTWWFGPPAMLKGWLDRVWVPGVAFSLDGRGGLRPLLNNIRRIGVVTTYGSQHWRLWLVGWPDRRLIGRGLRPLCAPGCRVDWIALAGMDCSTPAKRERFLVRVSARLGRWR
jgi:NAD(P)H dehydrogenase (quinone)